MRTALYTGITKLLAAASQLGFPGGRGEAYGTHLCHLAYRRGHVFAEPRCISELATSNYSVLHQRLEDSTILHRNLVIGFGLDYLSE